MKVFFNYITNKFNVVWSISVGIYLICQLFWYQVQITLEGINYTDNCVTSLHSVINIDDSVILIIITYLYSTFFHIIHTFKSALHLKNSLKFMYKTHMLKRYIWYNTYTYITFQCHQSLYCICKKQSRQIKPKDTLNSRFEGITICVKML